MLSTEQATLFTEMLAAIPFFPAEAGPRSVITEELAALCSSPEQAAWLVRRMIRLYRRWPGVIDLRLVYTSTFKALDGIESSAESEIYPNGIPSERLEPLPLLLPAGAVISAAPELDRAVKDLAELKDMNRLAPVKRREVAVWDEHVKKFTAADIETARENYRAEKARKEMHGDDTTSAGM